jgi:hypothetical protein
MRGNKFVAHHLGVSGELGGPAASHPYKLLLSYIHKDGTLKNNYTPHRKIFTGMLSLGVWRNFIDIDLNFAAEMRNVSGPLYGLGIQASKRF